MKFLGALFTYLSQLGCTHKHVYLKKYREVDSTYRVGNKHGILIQDIRLRPAQQKWTCLECGKEVSPLLGGVSSIEV